MGKFLAALAGLVLAAMFWAGDMQAAAWTAPAGELELAAQPLVLTVQFRRNRRPDLRRGGRRNFRAFSHKPRQRQLRHRHLKLRSNLTAGRKSSPSHRPANRPRRPHRDTATDAGRDTTHTNHTRSSSRHPDRPGRRPHHRLRHRPPFVVIPVPPLIVDEPEPGLPAGGGSAGPLPHARGDTPPLPVADWQNKPHRPSEIVVLVNIEGAEDTRQALMRDYNLLSSSPRPLRLLGSSVLNLTIPDQRPLADVLAAITADPRVLAAQVNFVYELMEGPDSPPPPGGATAEPEADEAAPASPGQTQYNLDALKVPEAHSLATGRDVLVAVVDTCIDRDHPELGGSVVESFDAVSSDAPVLEDASSELKTDGTCLAAEKHGTSVAGIIAAHRTLSSVAPKARLLSVRAFSAPGKNGQKPESTTHSLAVGIDWAISKGARIMNLSFAGPDDPLLKKLIGQAAQRGAILIAAAGNGGPAAQPLYPAAYAGVVAVTAVDAAKHVYASANRGAYITLAAPGVDILLATPDAGYAVDSGTSYAAAHVSGIAALMLERNPSLAADKLRDDLVHTTTGLGGEGGADVYGAGLADAYSAVAAVPAGEAGDTAASAGAAETRQ